jgi:hypothetical protein
MLILPYMRKSDSQSRSVILAELGRWVPAGGHMLGIEAKVESEANEHMEHMKRDNNTWY